MTSGYIYTIAKKRNKVFGKGDGPDKLQIKLLYECHT